MNSQSNRTALQTVLVVMATLVFAGLAVSTLIFMKPAAPTLNVSALHANIRNPERRLMAAFAPVSADDIPVLAGSLGDPDPDVAYTVAFLLKRIGAPAIPALTDRLTDPDAQVRQWADCALGMIGQGATNGVPALASLLADKSSAVRFAAAYALSKMGRAAEAARAEITAAAQRGDLPPDEIFTFAQHEETPGPPICVIKASGAIWLLDSKTGTSNSESIDEGFMNDAKGFLEFVMVPAARNLATKIGPADTDLAKLIEALANPEAGRAAVNTFFRMGATAIPPLIQALSNTNAKVRENAAVALGCMGVAAKESVPMLKAMLQSEPLESNGHCRACGAAVFALERMQPESIPSLLDLLRSDGPTPARYAASALGNLGKNSPRIIAALCEALNDSRKHVTSAAAFALGKIGPEARPASEPLRQLITTETEPEAALIAATALERIEPGGGQSLAVLLNSLRHAEAKVRVQAALGFRSLWADRHQMKVTQNGPVPVHPPLSLGEKKDEIAAGLASASRDMDKNVRLQAVRCLQEIPTDTDVVLRALEERLADNDWEVRNYAALALSAHNEPAIPHFSRALEHSDPETRSWAAFGLGHIGQWQMQDGAPAVPLLVAALSDAQPRVRQAAAQALGKLASRPNHNKNAIQQRPALMAVPTLVEQLSDTNQLVRVEVALTLAALEAATPAAYKILEESARDPALPRHVLERATTALRKKQ